MNLPAFGLGTFRLKEGLNNSARLRDNASP